ncbi:uncharacterized protein [Ptychodera flava]|uniref:uncharacterized protein n=1 Tax=Ptychodera flava TaxID=63121 RepID=UPI00396A178A
MQVSLHTMESSCMYSISVGLLEPIQHFMSVYIQWSHHVCTVLVWAFWNLFSILLLKPLCAGLITVTVSSHTMESVCMYSKSVDLLVATQNLLMSIYIYMQWSHHACRDLCGPS